MHALDSSTKRLCVDQEGTYLFVNPRALMRSEGLLYIVGLCVGRYTCR